MRGAAWPPGGSPNQLKYVGELVEGVGFVPRAVEINRLLARYLGTTSRRCATA
ncbi:MAG: hypothetical protein GY937_06565 [bacterium]|nr:hypothetical protein [bacterium]